MKEKRSQRYFLLRLREAQIKSNENFYKLLNYPFNENEIQKLRIENEILKKEKIQNLLLNYYMIKDLEKLKNENKELKERTKNCSCSPMRMYNTPK
jgi:hypothetical protein